MFLGFLGFERLSMRYVDEPYPVRHVDAAPFTREQLQSMMGLAPTFDAPPAVRRLVRARERIASHGS